MTYPEEGKERLALDLCLGTISKLVDRAGMTEVHGPDGGSLRVLTNERSGDTVGELRVWEGSGFVRKAVYAGIWAHVPGVITLDSHMVFAFTDPDGAVPHFTLDSVERGDLDTHAFHLDLIPRADLGSHLTYIDEVYEPLLEAHNAGKAIDGLSEAEIGPRQRAIMSPYMLAYRATPEAYRKLDEYVEAYLEQFFKLGEGGMSAPTLEALSDTDLPRRDAINRSYIFSPAVDPVWHHIIPLVGATNSEMIRRNLEFNELTTEVDV